MSWNPNTYPKAIRAEVHDYDELQDQVARATTSIKATDILDLGIGAGETAQRVLELHAHSHLVGIDSSSEMLRGAAHVLPAGRVTLLEQDLAAPLPDRDFDLVISALAIHHLEGNKKAELFAEVARHLRPGGLFVFGDVVVPVDPEDLVIQNEEGYDFPSSSRSRSPGSQNPGSRRKSHGSLETSLCLKRGRRPARP